MLKYKEKTLPSPPDPSYLPLPSGVPLNPARVSEEHCEIFQHGVWG